MACLVVGDTGKDRLCDSVYHARDQCMPHAVPFVGLGEVTHLPGGIELSEQHGEQVVVDDVEYIRDDQLAAETYHFPDRTEIKFKFRLPSGEVKVEYGHDRNECNGLCGHTPICETVGSQ